MYRLYKRVLAVVVLVLLASAAGYCDGHAFKRTEVGQKLENFELENFDGEWVAVSDAMGDKGLLLVFWAAWSPRSSEILKDLQVMYEEQNADGLGVLAVNVEHPEWVPAEEPKIQKAIEDANAKYMVVLDKDLSAFNHFGVVAVPSTMLVDKSMTVKNLYTGYSTSTRYQLRDDVLKLLGKYKEEKPLAHSDPNAYQPKGTAERFLHMGEMLIKKKRYSRAVSSLEQAIAEDPEYAAAYSLLAEAYEAEGEKEKAETARKKAEELGGAAPAESGADAAKKEDDGDKKGDEGETDAENTPQARMRKLMEERKKKAASSNK